jgi:hypothetical protein
VFVQVPQEKDTEGFKIAHVDPPEGREGDLIVVTGHGFLPRATVKLGTIPMLRTSMSKDGTAIAGTAPAGVQGKVDMTVANPDGMKVATSDAFTCR